MKSGSRRRPKPDPLSRSESLELEQMETSNNPQNNEKVDQGQDSSSSLLFPGSGITGIDNEDSQEAAENNEETPLLFLDENNRIRRGSDLLTNRFSFFGQSLAASSWGGKYSWIRTQSNDGFVLTKYPLFLNVNETVLCNRLRLNQVDKSAWFDADGYLRAEPDPLQQCKQAPISASDVFAKKGAESDSTFDLSQIIKNQKISSANILYDIFFGASYDPDGDYTSDNPLVLGLHSNNSFLPDLLIHIGDVELENSPLSNREFEKMKEVLGWWRSYEDKCKAQTSAILDSRIKGIKQQLKGLRESDTFSAVMTSKAYDELADTLGKLEDSKKTEDHAFRVTIWNLVKGWDELKNVRKSQGFQSTALTVHIQQDENRQPPQTNNEELTLLEKYDQILISITFEDHLITGISNCPPIEQDRRRKIENARFYIKIFVDDAEITQSEVLKLDLSMKIKIQESFIIKPNVIPQNIRVELYQKNLLKDSFIAKLYLPIPDHLHAIGNRNQQSVLDILSKFWFSSDSVKDETSGSVFGWVGDMLSRAIPFQNRNSLVKAPKDLIDGSITAGITWNKSENMGSLQSSRNTEYLKAARQMNRESLKQLGDYSDETAMLSGGSGMNKLNNAFLRSKNGVLLQEVSFRDFELGPKRKESGLIGSNFNESRKELTSRTSLISSASNSDSKEKISNNMKAADILNLMGLKKMKHVYDYVREERLPENDDVEPFWMRYIRVRRPLKPDRLEKKTFGSSTFREIDLLIHVVRGQNLPIRKNASVTNTYSEKVTGQGLRPFVEIKFKNYVVRTRTSDGTHPHWNETCLLSCIKESDNIAPSKYFDESVDHVTVNVFDDVITDINLDSRDKDVVKVLRQQRAWLGSFSIPISSIYLSGGIIGNFRLSLPKYHFGYEFEQGSDLMQHPEFDSTIQLSIAFNPLVSSHLSSIKYRFNPGEPEALLEYAEKWQRRFSSNQRKTTCVGTDGKVNLVCRYIFPQAPPENLTTFAAVTRFVSRIPYLSDNELLRSSCDLWCNSEQFLQLGTGDEEEHAVLLCNYALHMNLRSCIIAGRTTSNTKAIFVLIRDAKWTIIDPITGDSFSTDDPRCPLKSVGCIFDGTNIWANKQRYDEPFRMDFNFGNPANWEPFFSAKVHRPMPFTYVQKAELAYKAANQGLAKEIQALVKKNLISGIEEWRGRHSTRWNRYCCHIFDTILENYESSMISSRSSGGGPLDIQNGPLQMALGAVPGLSNDYQQLLKTSRIDGFIQDFGWPDTPAEIIETIKNTNIHAHWMPEVEFAVAVSCHAYPNDIFSIWVFVAAISAKK